MLPLTHLPRQLTAGLPPRPGPEQAVQAPLGESQEEVVIQKTQSLPQRPPDRASRRRLRAVVTATTTTKDRRPTATQTDLRLKTRVAILRFTEG